MHICRFEYSIINSVEVDGIADGRTDRQKGRTDSNTYNNPFLFEKRGGSKSSQKTKKNRNKKSSQKTKKEQKQKATNTMETVNVCGPYSFG